VIENRVSLRGILLAAKWFRFSKEEGRWKFERQKVTGFFRNGIGSGLRGNGGKGKFVGGERGPVRGASFFPPVGEGPVRTKASRRADSDVWFRVGSLLLLFLLIGFPGLMGEQGGLGFGEIFPVREVECATDGWVGGARRSFEIFGVEAFYDP